MRPECTTTKRHRNASSIIGGDVEKGVEDSMEERVHTDEMVVLEKEGTVVSRTLGTVRVRVRSTVAGGIDAEDGQTGHLKQPDEPHTSPCWLRRGR